MLPRYYPDSDGMFESSIIQFIEIHNYALEYKNVFRNEQLKYIDIYIIF